MFEGEKGNAMKTQRTRFIAAFLSAAILWAGQAALAQSSETFKARLSTVPIDVTMMSTIAGSGSLTAVLAGRKLTVTGSFQGLRSPATDAHIHRGPKGIRGPAILDLSVSKGTSGAITGTVELTPAQVEDLRSARLYVQINSERAPEGNLRGWLLP